MGQRQPLSLDEYLENLGGAISLTIVIVVRIITPLGLFLYLLASDIDLNQAGSVVYRGRSTSTHSETKVTTRSVIIVLCRGESVLDEKHRRPIAHGLQNGLPVFEPGQI